MYNRKFLFLYTELAGYTVRCLNELAAIPGIDVKVIHWPVNPEAPFKFDMQFEAISKGPRIDVTALLRKFSPDIIACSGWVDKDYLHAIKQDRRALHLISLDNQWEGSLRQWAGCIWSRWALKPHFHYCWVPGAPQFPFARRLGFHPEHILQGFYAADIAYFHRIRQMRRGKVCRRFLYTGRYVTHKGIDVLWEAFSKYRKIGGTWDLWCLGTGERWEDRPEMEGLHHARFVQPAEMTPYLSEPSVFILPSHFEPWGVVVHEMSAAGLPMLLSHRVGAGTSFLHEGQNGYFFDPGDVEQLSRLMLKMEHTDDEKLAQMGAHSFRLSQQNSPAIWADKVLHLLQTDTSVNAAEE